MKLHGDWRIWWRLRRMNKCGDWFVRPGKLRNYFKLCKRRLQTTSISSIMRPRPNNWCRNSGNRLPSSNLKSSNFKSIKNTLRKKTQDRGPNSRIKQNISDNHRIPVFFVGGIKVLKCSPSRHLTEKSRRAYPRERWAVWQCLRIRALPEITPHNKSACWVIYCRCWKTHPATKR